MNCNTGREITATVFCVTLALIVTVETVIIAVLLVRLIKGIKVEQEINVYVIAIWNWLRDQTRTLTRRRESSRSASLSQNTTPLQQYELESSLQSNTNSVSIPSASIPAIESLAMVMRTAPSVPKAYRHQASRNSAPAIDNLATIMETASDGRPSSLKPLSKQPTNRRHSSAPKRVTTQERPVIIFTDYDEVFSSSCEPDQEQAPTPYEVPISSKQLHQPVTSGEVVLASYDTLIDVKQEQRK